MLKCEACDGRGLQKNVVTSRHNALCEACEGRGYWMSRTEALETHERTQEARIACLRARYDMKLPLWNEDDVVPPPEPADQLRDTTKHCIAVPVRGRQRTMQVQ